MAHDQNGRVGPPRCEECNAPLNSDDPQDFGDPLLNLPPTPSLCLDCHLERHPFPKVKRKHRRAGVILLESAVAVNGGCTVAECTVTELQTQKRTHSFESVIPNPEVEPLVRPQG